MMARLMDNQPLGINGTEGTLESPQTGSDEYSRDLLGALEAFRDGKLVLAMERARQLRDKYPDKTDPLKITSSVYLASGMWGDARTELEKLLTLAPGDRHAMVNLAKLEIEAGNLERARNLLREVIESYPQDEQAVLLLVDVERRLGDQQAAAQVLEQAVTRTPGAASLRMALAEQYYRTGELTRVLEITNDLTSEQLQNHPAILELRGKAQERLGDPVAARSTFQRWTQLAPESAPAHYQYANSLAKTGERERAMTMLEQAVQLDPGYLPARIGEIKMQVHSGEVDVAKKTLAKLKTDFGDHPEVLGIEGWFALGTGDFTTAERAFSTALKTRPSSQTTILLSRALLGQQKKDEAVTVLQDWLNTNPRDLAVQLELADNYLTHDNHKAAIASYERVLELSPNNTKALNNLAWLSQDRDLEKSIEYAEKALELQPNDPLVLDTYGMLLLKQGDIMKAGKMLQRAADRAPDDLTIQLHLAQLLIRQQEYASAETALRKILNKAPETGEAKEARILLESIPGQ
jgi:putative PEP-CTERM system TPR-repeat lipoprotein